MKVQSHYSLYKKIKCYTKVFWSLVKARLRKKNIPFMVEFQLTKACNLKCEYCYAELETLTDKDYTFDQWKGIFDEFYSMGMRVARLLGGEPTIRKDLGDIIRYLKSKDVFIEIATNGMMLDKHLDALRLVDIVQISIDGDKAATDASRGKGAYEKIIAGINLGLANKLPVRIHGVFNKNSIEKGNESPVAHLAKLSKQYDIPFNFCQYVADFDGTKAPAYVPFSKTKPYHEECLHYKRAGYRYFNSDSAINQLLYWHDLNKDVIKEEDRQYVPKDFTRCVAGEMYCFFDSDGALYSCVPLWNYGHNSKKIGIKKAWENLSEVRKCKGCISCLSLGDIEFSKSLSLNPRVLVNTFTKVFSSGRRGGP